MAQRSLSRLMSLVLRHRPDEFGLVLDPEGFVPVDDLVAALRTRRAKVTRAAVEDVVTHNDPAKQRFSIVDDRIRANYGHSLQSRVAHDAAVPPDVLFHGTNTRAVDAILRKGLQPMDRQFVHLTPDLVVARQVGGRRGPAVIIEVGAAGAHASGVVFRQANPTFWLVDAVPPRFLRVQGAPCE